MEVIVTHAGTDFDGLAAMVACSRLHPQAKMVLVGTQRPNVRQFVSLHKDSLALYRAGQLNLKNCSVLYIVDANSCDRLADLSELCGQAGKVVVYDHHPPTARRPGIQEPLGATTTILVEVIREKGIAITAFEATLFLLGIYEDTGCLTYTSTTARDVMAAAWLLDKGAKLSEVRKYINTPLSNQQRELFETMLGQARTELVNQRSLLITEARLDQYVDGLGRLTQRLAELEDCDIVISIVQMEDRVHVVARSKSPELDLLEALRPLAVSGHPMAVSLAEKGADTAEVRRRIMSLLRANLQVGPLARDLMSSPVKTISDGTSIGEAHRLLLRYGHTGMPVVDDKHTVVGIISRRDVDKAIRHGLSHAPVRGYMTKNVVTVDVNTPQDEVTRLLVHNDIGRVPVLEKGRLVGIITRTDLLQQVHGEGAPRWHKPLYSQRDFRLTDEVENITDLINSRLPKRIQGILLLLGQKAEKEGYRAYAVGGFVRDLLLGVSNFDLDIVVEDNAIEFARLLPPLLGGKLHTHEEFGTATLVMPDGYQIDFATARMEFYQFPAAAPEVEETTIKHDLYRRDFTINTLAFCLNSAKFGKMLDFFNGQQDLHAGLVRVLYNLSFVEDPTRILRAIRFVCRYDFRLEDETRTYLDSALRDGMLGKVPPSRLGHEFRLIFRESNVPALLAKAWEMGVLKAVLPGFLWSDEFYHQLLAAARTAHWNRQQKLVDCEGWLLYPVLLLKELPGLKRVEALAKMGLTGREQKDVEKVVAELDQLSWELGQKELAASAIYQLLEPLPGLGLLALLAANPHQTLLRSRVLLYLEQLADVDLSIDGHDLASLGYTPGPRMGQVLKEVRRARLDGEVNTRDEELALARKLLAGEEEGED